MSQSFTPAEIVKVFVIFGIPKTGRGLVTTSFTHIPPVLARIWENTFMIGSFANYIEQVYISLDLATPEIVAEARIHLARWDVVGATSQLKVQSTTLGSGTIIDNPMERESIRQTLGNVLGIVVPQGGFYQEMYRKLNYQNEMAGSGDR